MGIKRFITCHVPVDYCNLRCSYCYLDHLCAKDGLIKELCCSPKKIGDFFSIDRTGGVCYFNLCGNGETMVHPQLCELVKELTSQGHYCDIITNGTISNRFDQLLNLLTEDELSRVFVKFSFHYLELKKRNLLNIFVENINKIKNSPASFSIEITPCDDLIPYITEVKEFSMKEWGALPHITVTREEFTSKIGLLTKLSKEDYIKTWSQFDSAMFNFKISVFGERRKEFCYAGDWSLEVDLATGNYLQCYHGNTLGNIKDITKPIKFKPICSCRIAHCFNSHAFLAFGDIPSLRNAPTYADERDRVTINGGNWLKPNCKEFFETKLYDNNERYSDRKEKLLSLYYKSFNQPKIMIKKVLKSGKKLLKK